MWLGCSSSRSVKNGPGVAEAQPLYSGAKLNLGDRVWGEVKKNSFIALPGKGGHSQLMPSRLYVSHWSRYGAIISRFKEQGVVKSWMFFWLVGGEVTGSQHPQPSGSNPSGGEEVYVLVGSIQLKSPPGGGFGIWKTTQRTKLRVSSIVLEEGLQVLDFA